MELRVMKIKLYPTRKYVKIKHLKNIVEDYDGQVIFLDRLYNVHETMKIKLEMNKITTGNEQYISVYGYVNENVDRIDSILRFVIEDYSLILFTSLNINAVVNYIAEAISEAYKKWMDGAFEGTVEDFLRYELDDVVVDLDKLGEIIDFFSNVDAEKKEIEVAVYKYHVAEIEKAYVEIVYNPFSIFKIPKMFTELLNDLQLHGEW